MDKNNIKESLFFYNPWWQTKKVPGELLKNYQRPVLKRLFSYLPLERIIVLKGPRRTGKTTIFYQMVDQLISGGASADEILFLSFDDIKLRLELDEILKAYQEVHRRVIKEGRTVYIFLDEVQFLENWPFQVKKYFDRKYPLKFLVSGSAATLIRKDSESLAGRTVEETIYPFSFYEYLSYRLKNQRLAEAIDRLRDRFIPFDPLDVTDLIPDLMEIKIVLEEYLEKGGFPNLFEIKEGLLWKKLVREDIVEKVIYRDLVDLYDIKKPEVLEKLFFYLADITSQILSVTNISNSLGLSREYTDKYLFYLEQALLVRRLKKFSRSVEKTIRSMDKVHLLDSGLITAFANPDPGQLLESVVASHLLRREGGKVYYYRDKYEVDLVFADAKRIFPIEVKYKDDFSRRDLNGLILFGKKFKTGKSLVVSRNYMKKELHNGQEIIYLPAWLFLLLI